MRTSCRTSPALWHHAGRLRPAPVGLAAVLSCTLLAGCAALTNPLVDGIPVHRLPPELLAAPKNPSHTIPLTVLEQKKPPVYLVAPGDVLAVYIETVLGDKGQPIPSSTPPLVVLRDQRTVPPAIGYPVAVREDGAIALPFIEPLKVAGMSVAAIQEAIVKQYTSKEILHANKERVFVSILYPRRYQVVVMRQEAGSFVPGPDGVVPATKRGTGHLVELAAGENDVLHALALTGGLPGLDAYDAVVIEHNCFHNDAERAVVLDHLQGLPANCSPLAVLGDCGPVVRIPLRVPDCQPVPVRPEDVVLDSGDVVFIEARDCDVFYTGGLLPAGEHVLPRDRDLDVIEAVSQVHGPLVNGAFATNNLAGNLIAPGIGGPSPSLLTVLRRTPHGLVPIRVDLDRAMHDPRERLLLQAGDVLVLQERPGEALARYFTQTVLNFDLFWEVFHSRFGTGALDVAAPERLPSRPAVVNLNQPAL
jgi:protein involved in polysaccharide export with SLBB domain